MPSWGYLESNGPSTWEKEYIIEGKMGKRQSPIKIESSKAVYDSQLAEKSLSTKYKPENKLCLKNNGHSIMCQISSDSKSVLEGGPLEKNTYQLEQFHLHWGSNDSKGSEHTIDDKQYAAELHLVHWNSSKYGSFAEAADKEDGLAVLGVMIDVGSENKAFNAITDNVEPVRSKETETLVDKPFDPTSLLPDITKYWTYEGSLTTPPLFESVLWIVLKDPVYYSADQMKKLRSLIDSDGNCMQDNFRPAIPAGERKVRASFA